jgi:hypothetical protein
MDGEQTKKEKGKGILIFKFEIRVHNMARVFSARRARQL